ncbi:hypothetical protein NEFER03_0129 [Nematocida sp. LUAm3]|nr:hypothetical protein NEFER03_0129 [Nematocida sp. LUAm3]KAI5173582.1 hypothetical protein NEFER02_0098 [Nematocida sp. LUAm2]KAI5176803.1 hypothetical protein NEFER01_0128 [Nematocida sp. LUAm1]
MCVLSLGRVFNREWMVPVNSPYLSVVLKSGSTEESLDVRYIRAQRKWSINGDPVETNRATEISFGGSQYYISLRDPSEEYLYEIDQISRIISNTKNKEISQAKLLKHLRVSQGVTSKNGLYYVNLLKSSKCFIKISLEDAFGAKKRFWKVNTKQLDNFRRIKGSRQMVLIEVVDHRESISLFYLEETNQNASVSEKEQKFILSHDQRRKPERS